VNSKSQLANQLSDKAYRDAYVASQIRVGLPMQCRALRENLELTQPELAKTAGMTQPRISELERPGERKLNIETLLRLASAFDVALQVRFVPFSRLVDDDDAIDLDNFYIRPYEEDMEHLKKLEDQMQSVAFIKSGLERSAKSETQKLSALAPQAPSQTQMLARLANTVKLENSEKGSSNAA